MTDALKTVRTRTSSVTHTPQTQKAAKGQKPNNAGGYVFTVDKLTQAKRFLILGSDTNYYEAGAELSKKNAKILVKLAENPETAIPLVDLIVDVSVNARAPKVNPQIFALAISASHGSVESKQYALSKLSEVARTGTHLFLFATYVTQFRGWGRALSSAVARWYTDKPTDKMAYQAVKYQSRGGYTHRDLFRLSHPVSEDPAFKGLGEWILRKDASNAPKIVQGFVKAFAAETEDLPGIITEYGLTWEMLPTEALNDRKVWEALLDGNVPLGALLRQLPRLTNLGFFTSAEWTTKIISRLTDAEEIKRSRLHPIAILTAAKTYSAGRSYIGRSVWIPAGKIVSALDKAFYLAFGNVESSGSRVLYALDVSGSMGAQISDNSPLSAREATAAMALVTAATEPNFHAVGFTGGGSGYWGSYGTNKVSQVGSGPAGRVLTELTNDIDPGRRLDDVVRSISNLPFGATDATIPIRYAIENGLKVDLFVVATDNETWSGHQHVHEALKEYRKTSGINAKLAVLATTATKFTIGDPNDPGTLNLAGFDATTPQVLSEFAKGNL